MQVSEYARLNDQGQLELRASCYDPWRVQGFGRENTEELGKEIVRLGQVQKMPKPTHWPPQKDDVWEARGNLWHVKKDGTMVVFDGTNLSRFQEVVLQDYPGIKLVFRRGNTL